MDAAVEAITAPLVDILKTLMTSQYRNMMNEVENEIHRMQDEFGILRAFCREVDSRDEVRELDLERLMKEVGYDMEDIVESWIIQMKDDMTRNKIVRKFLIQGHGSQLKREIKSFKEGRLEPITRRIQAYRDLQIEANQVYLSLP